MRTITVLLFLVYPFFASGMAESAIGSGKSAPFQIDTRPVPGAPQNMTLLNEKNINRAVNHQPEFRWVFQGVNASDRQTAYQCRVLSGQNPVWDSGKVVSAEAKAVFGSSTALLGDGQTYTVQVRIWNNTDKESAWSQLLFRMNTAPPLPVNPRPVNGVVIETDKQSEIAEWDLSSEIDDDPISVRLLGDLNVQIPQTSRTVLSNTSGALLGLSRDGIYIWQVVVSDGYEESAGPVWSFQIRGSAPVAHVQTVKINDTEIDKNADAVYAQLGTDRLSFSGYWDIRGNPAKTIVSHRWLLKSAESTDAKERMISTASSFNIAALDIGSGTFHLIYNVTDSENNVGIPDSITVIVRPDVGQAIIVAGGGYLGDNYEAFFNYTTSVTNNTYNLLVNRRRYSREAITYLNPIRWDQAAHFQNILHVSDIDLSPGRLKAAIESASERNVKQKIPLLIFLAGHGGEGVFYMSDNISDNMVLKASDLRQWLDELNRKKMDVSFRNPPAPNEKAIFPGEVVVVVDFCYSRTFLEQISGPGRVVIGSSSDQVASVSKGRSFGSFFFDGVSKGWDAFRCFESARDRIKASFDQEPYIDADGDKNPVYDVTGRRNAGTEGDEQIARSIFIGGEFINLSRLNPEIDAPDLQKQPDNIYVLTAMADKELTLYVTVVPQPFDPKTFANLSTQKMAVQTSGQNGNKQLYLATWTSPRPGDYVLLVQGIDNLNNVAAHRAVSVLVGDHGPFLKADFDGNSTVDFYDFLVFVSGFGKTAGDSGWDMNLDLNNNGTIDFTDFLEFARQFGKVYAAKPARNVISQN